MSSTAHSILDAALRLADAERAEIAKSLLESLPSDAVEHEDDELAAEMDRRFAEFERGEAQTLTWEELRGQR